MKLNKIDIDVFKLLINHEFLLLEQITFFLDISIVTARNSVKKLNIFLKNYELGDIKKEKTKYSLILEKNEFSFLENEEDEEDEEEISLSSEERISYIIVLLIFEKKVNLTQLTDIFEVSRNTLNADLVNIKKFLKKFNLTLKSISWQGILLEGDFNDIKEFTINYLIKLLIIKEFSGIVWKLYGKYLNPFVKNYLDNIYEDFDLSQLKNIQQKIINSLDFEVGVYGFKRLECMLIYHKVFNNDIIKNFKSLELRQELVEKYNSIYKKLENISQELNLNENKLVTESLAVSVLSLTEEYIYYEYKDLTYPIAKRSEEIYSVRLNKKELTLLAQIVGTAYFKYDFSIVSYLNYFITSYSIPESVINDIKYNLKKYKVTFHEEDYYTLAIYLYDTICKRYKEIDFNVKFLIIDSSFRNWLGYELKSEFLKHLPHLEIKVISVYNVEILESSLTEEYDYILFTNYTDKKILLKKNPNLIDKVYYVKYNDFFEINNLWGQLFFDPGAEASLPFIKKKLKKHLF